MKIKLLRRLPVTRYGSSSTDYIMTKEVELDIMPFNGLVIEWSELRNYTPATPTIVLVDGIHEVTVERVVWDADHQILVCWAEVDRRYSDTLVAIDSRPDLLGEILTEYAFSGWAVQKYPHGTRLWKRILPDIQLVNGQGEGV